MLIHDNCETHVRPKKLNSLLAALSFAPANHVLDVPIVAFLRMLSSQTHVSRRMRSRDFIYAPTAAPHAECTLRPILARFVAASISRMPLASVDGRQVSRGRSRGYGRQFGGAFSPRLSIRPAVHRFIRHDGFVAGMPSELTGKKERKRTTRKNALLSTETGDVLTLARSNY